MRLVNKTTCRSHQRRTKSSCEKLTASQHENRPEIPSRAGIMHKVHRYCRTVETATVSRMWKRSSRNSICYYCITSGCVRLEMRLNQSVSTLLLLPLVLPVVRETVRVSVVRQCTKYGWKSWIRYLTFSVALFSSPQTPLAEFLRSCGQSLSDSIISNCTHVQRCGRTFFTRCGCRLSEKPDIYSTERTKGCSEIHGNR